MEDEFTYRPQDVSYLGFLETQLRDLQGIATLAYELIQNADDAKDPAGLPASSRILFDVREDALVVENDSVFRPVDFDRLQTIAGGGKRLEAATTGAFGLGFLAVYQVTDAPEIYSGGRHWTIHPEAAPEQRIRERKTPTTGTRFYLPWAFDPQSVVRQRLRLSPVRPETLDELAHSIGQALELAALFLRQLQILEVKRNGQLVRRIEREQISGEPGTDRLLHLRDDSGQRATWLLFQGTIASAELRARYPGQIEEERSNLVRLAVLADDVQSHGRLFAGLPTDTTTPLPFHVNADFFPTSDRKRIHFAGGYQAEWNQAALQVAARLLAAGLETVRRRLPPPAFWKLLQQIAYTRELANQGELPAIFATFWLAVAPLFAQVPLLYTVQETWVLPAHGRVPDRMPPAAAFAILRRLSIPLAHPSLASAYELMRTPEVGVPALALTDLVRALIGAGLSRATPLTDAPPFLAHMEALQALWHLLEGLTTPHARPEARARDRQLLNQVALVLTEEMTLERPDRVFRGSEAARALFPGVAWIHPSLPERGFPGRLVTEFGVRQAVTRLAEMPIDRLEDRWRMGRLDLPRLFRWFESRQIEIFADDPDLQKEIRRLPLCPVAGELRPLASLYIPGGFEDPLGVAGTVPLEAVGGRRHFLEDLGVEPLSFDTYLRREMPRALVEHPDLPSDARHRLLHLLAERLGEFRDDDLLREQLGHLPLIPCLDGSFRPALEVYATRQARTILGDQTHVAEPPPTRALEALHRWLGVRDEPSVPALVQRLVQLAGRETEAAETVQAATHCWHRLQEAHAQGKLTPAALAPLRRANVIPVGSEQLARPDTIFFDDSPDISASFSDLEEHLLAPDRELAPVWALAGVRPLSQVLRLQITTPAGYEPAPALQETIDSRAGLLRRIALAEGASPSALDFLDELRAVRATPLHVRYRLDLSDEEKLSAPSQPAAALDRDTGLLYVGDDPDDLPWLAIAREIARALKGQKPAGGLVLAIKEVLAAETEAAARMMLDELGYPS